MASQTLIVHSPTARGRADCEPTEKPHAIVEILSGDTAGIMAALPMSPLLMDDCKGMACRRTFSGRFGNEVWSFR